MKQALKQRIVGGIVLGSLLLIIIPMVVDFSREEPSPLELVVIPPGPEVMKMEVLPLDDWAQPIEPEIDSQQKIIEMPTPITEQPVTEAAKEVAKETAKETPPVVKPKPAPTLGPSAVVWAVQVASFDSESNALKLRDRLRQKGYASFVERGSKPSGDVIYRVKVGPVLQRAEADELKKKVKADFKLDGIIIRHR